MPLTCLLRLEFEPAALIATHPPAMRHPNKQQVWDLACPPGAKHSGTIELTRWAAASLPEHVKLADSDIASIAGVYDYAGSDAGVWHVNFADPRLFVAYGSPLLAQDELQCVEHPALCSVREAMVAAGWPALTAEGGAPTPVLVSGVERRCALDTRRLYGNRFAAASASLVLEVTRVLDPPTRTNLIAIAALTGGRGCYSRAQIHQLLTTAYTGFAAAAEESRRRWPGTPVEVRTGFWGCGAFGGHRALMTLLQVLAARLAGIDRLRFFTVAEDGRIDFDDGAHDLAAILAGGATGEPLDAVLERIVDLNYRWGAPNGT